MRHEDAIIERKEGEEVDPISIVSKSLETLQSTVDDRLKAVADFATETSKIAARIDKLEAKANRPHHGGETRAEPTEERERTWLNRELIDLYCRVHQLGYAHSVEAWQEGRLVGGLYGIHLGAAYFGESMFSRVRDASKVALVELVGRLRAAGFKLLDTQFVTDHLTTFGCIEISRAEYRRCLAEALRIAATFPTDAGVYWGLALGTGSSGGGSGSVFSNCGSAHSTTQTS